MGAVEWHDAPARQFVITLSGTLEFQTRTGEHLKLTRFRGARQAFNGGFSDAQDASALFT